MRRTKNKQNRPCDVSDHHREAARKSLNSAGGEGEPSENRKHLTSALKALKKAEVLLKSAHWPGSTAEHQSTQSALLRLGELLTFPEGFSIPGNKVNDLGLCLILKDEEQQRTYMSQLEKANSSLQQAITALTPPNESTPVNMAPPGLLKMMTAAKESLTTAAKVDKGLRLGQRPPKPLGKNTLQQAILNLDLLLKPEFDCNNRLSALQILEKDTATALNELESQLQQGDEEGDEERTGCERCTIC